VGGAHGLELENLQTIVGITVSDPSNALVMAVQEALIRTIGALGPSRFLEAGGCVCCDGGTDSAYENYALLDPPRAPDEPGEARRLVRRVLDFFALTGRPHVWPIFGNMPEAVVTALGEAGAAWGEGFTAMTADIGGNVVTADDPAWHVFEPREDWEAHEWADAAWYGFDSGEPAPGSFREFASEMMRADSVRLFAVRPAADQGLRPEIASTGMLTASDEAAGIYYVSTLPGFRRRGSGGAVMRAMIGGARAIGYDKITLMATSSGYPMYRRFGFQDRGRVGVGVFGEP
jgi:ribosomal protein S18 acetylase RimI-like enzyme